MRALLSMETGGPETLVVSDIVEPIAGIGEVIVDVAAAALNFMDTLVIRDRYQVKPPRPFSPSAECAGIISAVGPGVTGRKVGDRVMAYLGHGAARQKVAVAADLAVPVPDEVPLDVAATLPVAYGTTVHALRERGRLGRGQTLVVTGATGGVGQAAVEIGKLMGARVIACVTGSGKIEVARAIGADEVIDVSAGDLKEAVKALTNGEGADVVYDAVGADLAEPLIRATGWGGRYLVIGFAGGEIPKIPLNLVLLKSIDVVGVHWGAAVGRDPASHVSDMRWLLGEVSAGRLRPTISGRYPLERAAEALAEIAERRVKGKIVLVP